MQNRDDFQWRPNDNSVTTNLRYDLEAEHWTRAFRSAEIKSSSGGAGDLAFIGILFSLVIHLIFLIIVLIYDGIKWLIELNNKRRRKKQVEIRRKENERLKKVKRNDAYEKRMRKHFAAGGKYKTTFDFYGEPFIPEDYDFTNQ